MFAVCATIIVALVFCHAKAQTGSLRFILIPLWAMTLVAAWESICIGQSSGTTKAARDGTKTLYRRLCQGCHGAEGHGLKGVEGIPDFTRREWHDRREDVNLIVSILEGKSTGMPAFNGRLNETEVRELVTYVRAFSRATPNRQSPKESSREEFEERFQKLQREFQALKEQLDQLNASDRPSKPRTELAIDTTNGGRLAAKQFYAERCQRCHGADGKGIREKVDCDELPDFRKREWQEHRSDKQLITSILEGKNVGMPAFRKHVGEEQVRDLVDYIRSFTPPRNKTPASQRQPSDASSGR